MKSESELLKSVEKEPSREEKMNAIREYVAEVRRNSNIQPGKKELFELSCETIGEFCNLVDRQLVNTEEGFGAWKELDDEEVLQGAYRYVMEGKRS